MNVCMILYFFCLSVHLTLFYGSKRLKSVFLFGVCVRVRVCVVNAIESVTAPQAVKRAVAMVTERLFYRNAPVNQGIKYEYELYYWKSISLYHHTHCPTGAGLMAICQL